MNKSTKANSRSPGRPTADQAKKRHEQLLDTALVFFAEKGFAGTAIATLAEHLGMTKRTIYALYPNKDALFKAALDRGMEQVSLPLSAYEAVEKEDLAETLYAVASLRVSRYVDAGGRRVQQVIVAESSRFPELVGINYRASPGPAIEFISRLLKERLTSTKLNDAKANALAEMFLGASVGTTVNAVNAGTLKPNKRSIEPHITLAVKVFVNGVERAAKD